MKCPFCLYGDTNVLESRLTTSSDSVRRRRECDRCKKRFTTYERVELNELMVVKKDGRREPFSREKLFSGIQKACQKRPVKTDRINQAVDKIESILLRLGKDEVKSKYVGELVMEHLKELDVVAYVRFASVYRRFHDASQFAQEVKNLKSSPRATKTRPLEVV